MTLHEQYLAIIRKKMDQVFTQKEAFAVASDLVVDCIKKDALIYVYGSGHSHMLAEELFYRAGGLANIYPVFIEKLMLHEAAATSSVLEKQEGLLKPYFDEYPMTKDDILLVISTSGRNGTPVDAALYGREKGLKVITVSSPEYAKAQPASHSSGKYLFEIGDVNFNNDVDAGDAALHKNGFATPFTPVSTILSVSIVNSIMADAIGKLIDEGYASIPVFLSGNIAGSSEHNEALVKRYSKRIKPL